VSAIFLDRDGVINANRDTYVTSWSDFQFLPGALDALRILTHHKFRIFVVTNQSIVNQGRITQDQLETIHSRMLRAVNIHGGVIHDIRYCPHRQDEQCGCRKPQPGMLFSLAQDWGINLSQTYLVGDAITDIQAGQTAGCQTLMVLTGRGTEQVRKLLPMGIRSTYVLRNLLSAAQWILAAEGLSVLDPALQFTCTATEQHSFF